MSDISIRPAAETWVVRAGGAVIAESRSAMELTEGNLPFVIYFPRDDVGMAFLDESDYTTICPKKGTARYFHLVTGNKTIANAAWSYEEPLSDAEPIKGYIAFYASDDVAVEQL